MNKILLLLAPCCLAVAGATDLPAAMHRSNAVFSLHECAQAGAAEGLKARLKAGDDANALDELGNTPLLLAAAAQHAEAVRLLLENGADPMARDKAGHTAAELAQDETVLRLCREGEAARTRELELASAVTAGDAATVANLLGQGGNPNALTEDHSATLLILAAGSGDADITRLLLAAGADVTAKRPTGDKWTALHAAAAAGKPEVAAMLLQAGADPMAQANNGSTPLHEAVWNGRAAVVEVLLKLPAYRICNFYPDGRWLPSPVNMAITHGKRDIVRLFCENGYDPNVAMRNEDPALFTAVKSGHRDIAEMLIKTGADKKLRDKDGKTAADYAEGDLKNLF